MAQEAPSSSAACPRRAILWTRVSTDMQEAKGLSITEQRKELLALAKRDGIEVVHEFGEACSAYKEGAPRPEFNRMMQLAKEDSTINTILVHDYSRLTREPFYKAIQLVRDLQERFGVDVVSLSDPPFDRESASGAFVEAFTYAKNAFFSREVALHTKKGCRANIRSRDPETGWCYKNGGKPLFGYRLERFKRGESHFRDIIKTIWVPDETIVASRPVCEWARAMLVDLAMTGKSLDQIRDFLNKAGVPAPKGEYWSCSSINSMLESNCLLKYAGFGVWNVHSRHGRHNPTAEWEIVENSHEALITEEELGRILTVREGLRSARFDKGYHRSRDSDFLLSGGLFKCGRCGSNLTGLRRAGDLRYYVCGSHPNRRGMGCGKAVYVPAGFIEEEVVKYAKKLLNRLVDPRSLARRINSKLAAEWNNTHLPSNTIRQRLQEVRKGITNINLGVEAGSVDLVWAASRLRELKREEASLEGSQPSQGKPPQIDIKCIRELLDRFETVFKVGTNSEKKAILRNLVDRMTMAPESLEIEIVLKAPEPLVHRLVAGAGFEPATFGL